MSDVTRILDAIQRGEPTAANELLPLVYDELRKLAGARLAHEQPGQTLSATALVHDAYLRLVGGHESIKWNSRGHFFAAAAEAMRRILIEQARHRARLKRGGQRQQVDLDSGCAIEEARTFELLALDEALTKLAAIEPVKADLVKLRFFAGFSETEIASLLNMSERSVQRHWSCAKAWLFDRIEEMKAD